MIPTYVNLEITTHCDQRCPNCCSGIGINRTLQHHTWEYFKRAASALYGIPRVNLTGGEPTLHPQFADFLPRFKATFGCQQLTMNTDGFRVEKYRDIIERYLDVVDFSDYHMGRSFQSRVLVNIFDAGTGASNFIPRSHRGGGNPCFRAWHREHGGIAYADGRIFGCCVAPGIDGAESIEPEPGWIDRIPKPPCADCWWSE